MDVLFYFITLFHKFMWILLFRGQFFLSLFNLEDSVEKSRIKQPARHPRAGSALTAFSLSLIHLGMIGPFFKIKEHLLKNCKFLCMKQTEPGYYQALKRWIWKVRKPCLHRVSIKVRNFYRVLANTRQVPSFLAKSLKTSN